MATTIGGDDAGWRQYGGGAEFAGPSRITENVIITLSNP